jgi:hypothetical protein
MVFNVNDFKTSISQRGIIQTNKYKIDIFFANTALFGAMLNTEQGQVSMSDMCSDLSDRCVSAGIPSLTLRAANINRYGLGVMEEMPFTGIFSNLPLTFICDAQGAVYNFWYGWQSVVFGAAGQASGTLTNQFTPNIQYYTQEYKSNYMATINLTVYDNGGNISSVHNFYNAFPLATNASELSWGETNNLVKLGVVMSFKEWQPNNSIISTTSTS